MLKKRYQLLLIAALILVAYYPNVFAGFSRIDDTTMIDGYAQVIHWNSFHFISIFATTGNLYYRPLIVLSYFLDKLLLGFNPSLMHLENILLHLGNAVLVFFLTRRILPTKDRDISYLPLLAAILFGLHPINAESVSWISGRTDVLALTFILISSLLIIKFKETAQFQYVVLSLCALLAGASAKETALAFLPGFVLIVNARQYSEDALFHTREKANNQILRKNILLITGCLIVAFVSFMPRAIAFVSHDSRMAMTIRYIFTDWMHTMFVALQAFGFYVKKLVYPFPLNFSIMDVDPGYEIIAVPVVALCIYNVFFRTYLSAIFLTGVSLIIPAFVLAMNQIAWTPYAERYVYMTSAYFTIAIVIAVDKVLGSRHARIVKIVVPTLIVVMLAFTMSRCLVWQNDYDLVKDTVEKSPMSRDMRLVYGNILAGRGNYGEALQQLEQGEKIPRFGYDDRFDLLIGAIYERQGEINKAIGLFETALKKPHGLLSPNVLGSLVELLEQKKEVAQGIRERNALNRRIFSYTLKLFKLNHDPHLLYKLGLISTELGQDARALMFFRQACNNMNYDDGYRKMALGKIETLSRSARQHHAKNS